MAIVIHQPSELVYSLFDDLLLLSNGKVCYFGEATEAKSHFESLGFSPRSDSIGAAEFLLDTVSVDSEDEEGSLARIDELAATVVPVPRPNSSSSSPPSFSSRRVSFRPVASYLKQFRLLFTRSLKEILRSKATLSIKIVQQVMTALVYGGIYQLKDSQVRRKKRRELTEQDGQRAQRAKLVLPFGAGEFIGNRSFRKPFFVSSSSTTLMSLSFTSLTLFLFSFFFFFFFVSSFISLFSKELNL